jgi:hypothetical protein
MKHIHKKDKILAKDAALVVAEAVIDEIAKLLPGINIAWGLSKALYGAGMKLRQERVLEWVEMVRDNPTIFTDEIFITRNFRCFVLGRFSRIRQHCNRFKQDE